jgi:hypothetical protein
MCVNHTNAVRADESYTTLARDSLEFHLEPFAYFAAFAKAAGFDDDGPHTGLRNLAQRVRNFGRRQKDKGQVHRARNRAYRPV